MSSSKQASSAPISIKKTTPTATFNHESPPEYTYVYTHRRSSILDGLSSEIKTEVKQSYNQKENENDISDSEEDLQFHLE